MSSLASSPNRTRLPDDDANNQRIRVSRDEVDGLAEADVPPTPERLLESLTPQELRDLFAYLRDAPNQ